MRSLMSRFGIAGQLLVYLWAERLWWMIPLIVLLLAVAGLIAFASATALAPFIYPLI